MILLNQNIIEKKLSTSYINVTNSFLAKYKEYFRGKSFNISECPPGFDGALCNPCENGHFKPFYGSRSCIKCPCLIDPESLTKLSSLLSFFNIFTLILKLSQADPNVKRKYIYKATVYLFWLDIKQKDLKSKPFLTNTYLKYDSSQFHLILSKTKSEFRRLPVLQPKLDQSKIRNSLQRDFRLHWGHRFLNHNFPKQIHRSGHCQVRNVQYLRHLILYPGPGRQLDLKSLPNRWAFRFRIRWGNPFL